MDSVTEFIRNGENGKQTGQIGLEVEHFLLNRQTGRPMEYDEIARLLEELAPLYCTSVYEQGNRISLENHWTLITLEPGCQLELSFRCTPDLKKIEEKYRQAIAPTKRDMTLYIAADYRLLRPIRSGGSKKSVTV